MQTIADKLRTHLADEFEQIKKDSLEYIKAAYIKQSKDKKYKYKMPSLVFQFDTTTRIPPRDDIFEFIPTILISDRDRFIKFLVENGFKVTECSERGSFGGFLPTIAVSLY